MGIFDSKINADNIHWKNDGTIKWTLTTKPRDYDRPFHRINSPDFKPSEPQAPGTGYDCGCRSPKSDYHWSLGDLVAIARATGAVVPFPLSILAFPVLLPYLEAKRAFNQLLRTVPGWVPVGRNSYDSSFQEQIREMEGVLYRSFQTWTDVPLLEWHRWYDWNFHVVPAPWSAFLRGKGNDVESKKEKGWKPVGSERSMECEWDAGSFGRRPGPMYDTSAGGVFDPAHDWAWPAAGQAVWLAGRHIYDCGHASSDDKGGSNPGLMRTELHPCLAVASARWEGVNFTENGAKYVPAIQFAFFTSRLGGYWQYDTVKPGGYDTQRQQSPNACKDYEFILDLPDIGQDPSVGFDIGHTPDYPFNTIVLRPQLLMKFDYSPFTCAQGQVAAAGAAVPVVTLVSPADPKTIPLQANIKIPLSGLADNVDAYGVIASLGWYDPDLTESAKVRKVTVHLLNIVKGNVNHDVFAEEWELKVGVNGRWFYVAMPDDSFHNGATFTIDKTLTFYLALDDYINLSMHGHDRNLVGDFFKQPDNTRKLQASSQEPFMTTFWKLQVDQSDNSKASGIARDVLVKLAKTVKDENTPIGLIDAAQESASGDAPNPYKVQKFIDDHGEGNQVSLQQTGFETKEDEHSAELFYNNQKMDYILHYTIKVEAQP